MRKTENIAWVSYIDELNFDKLKKDKCGKWVIGFSNKEFAAKMCENAVLQEAVCEAKHNNAESGVCCFYLNGDDVENHKKIIKYFLENNLIRKTKTGKLYNIAFKYDTQTQDGKYGENFIAEIKLEKFINLETQEWI